jgi:hypothetical protein
LTTAISTIEENLRTCHQMGWPHKTVIIYLNQHTHHIATFALAQYEASLALWLGPLSSSALQWVHGRTKRDPLTDEACSGEE